MKKLLSLLLLISLGARAANYQRSVSSEEKTMPEDDYSWVDQLNFDKKTEEKYNADKDEFKLSSEEKNHALVKESLVSLPESKLEESYKKESDPLTKINMACYLSKFDEAFKTADSIYMQYKNNTSYWNQIGTCYYLKSDFSKAILFYNKSRDLDSKFTPPVNNLGVVYQKQGRFQKALAAFKKAYEMSSFSATPAFNLAQLYLKFGTIGKALPILEGLKKKSSGDVEVLSALSVAYLLKGNNEQALDTFSLIEKATLTRASIGLNYAVALKLNNKNEEATQAFNSIQNSAGELKDYATRVEKFIKN